MQIKRADGQWRALLCCNERVDGKSDIMMWKLKGRMDKGHYDVQIKRWMKKVAL